MKKAVLSINNSTVGVTVFECNSRVTLVEQTEVSLEDFKKPSDVKEFVLDIPPEEINFRILQLPFKDPSKAERVIPYEIAAMTTKNPDEMVIVTERLSEDGRYLVGYVDRQWLQETVDTLEKKGIGPLKATSAEFLYLIQTGGKPSESPLQKQQWIELISEYLLKGGPDFLDALAGRQAKRALLSAVINRAVLLLVLVLGFVLLDLSILYNKHIRIKNALETELQKTFATVMPASKAVAPVYQVKATIKQLQQSLKGIDSPDILQMLLGISEHWTDDCKMHEIEFRERMVKIRGSASTLEAVENLKESLQRVFPSVRVVQTEKVMDERYRFVIRIGGEVE